MGYYTDYELYIENCFFSEYDEIKQKLIDSIGYDPFCQDVKWYGHELDMILFSKNYPDKIFILNGVGEEYPDIWRKYFKNGKIQTEQAIISFGECIL